MMAKDWQVLAGLTNGKSLIIERVKVLPEEVHIEGAFELPPLAQLSADEQVFVASFLRAHGSIKEMERLFGISYPTVKSRLNSIVEKLGFINVDLPTQDTSTKSNILDQLNNGTISAQEAIQKLKQSSTN